MIRVLITDDHAIVREGLRQIVSETSDVSVVAEASTAAETLTVLRSTSVDVVVLDLNLPDRHGLDLLLQLRASHPRLPVLILSVNREPAYAVRLLKAGASGYVGKDSAREQLVEAIRRVAAGEKYLAPQLAESVAIRLVDSSDREAHERLSDREFEILKLLASGKTVSQIGELLSLSVKTISTHRTRILRKMGMKTNAELMHYAVRNGLVQ